MWRVRSLVFALLVLVVSTSSAAAAPSKPVFLALLSGNNEVPPVATSAQGVAVLQISPDESQISYKVIVTQIDNATQAHIHCGPPGQNGPVVAFLFGPNPNGVSVNGLLAAGVLTEGSVIPRPDSSVCPGGVANLSDLIEKIRSGGAYVNVHTTAHPGGEIRGQLF